ncbi:MAG TPA: rhodanese-like domain-containing protein [Gaiellaceae bacterium]|nr:rhodanese-like domain-containing protein [Gaiellaceae bacterium]
MGGLREIATDELRALLEEGAGVVLVDALSPISYAGAHLPGAVNIPPERVDDLAPRRIPALDSPVVVYCAGEDCDSSVAVARRLLGLGYRDVRHYAGGKEAWRASGLPLEGGRTEGV